MSSVAQPGVVHLGLDVHKNSISVGVLHPEDAECRHVHRITNDEPSVRRLLAVFDNPARLRTCYEAGPTGYELARLLHARGVACDVVAPSLIPRAPGDRVKTDRRDCRRLARLHRAGELTPIRVPSAAEEAVRDLCRARADLVEDLSRVRHQLNAFLLRHGRVWRDGNAWTLRHEQWLAGQRFDDRAAQLAFSHYRAVLEVRDAQLAAITGDLAAFFDAGPFVEQVHRLAAYRGLTRLGALTLASEVVDWRRFPAAPPFMAFTGLVPSEYSSGESTRRGRITKTGNAHLRTQLIESAWSYQHRPSLGAPLRGRQDGVSPDTVARSWRAQQRLCARYRRLTAARKPPGVAITAVARELAGFLWAEMTA
jgi:transposase